jgi:hypothetical protein
MIAMAKGKTLSPKKLKQKVLGDVAQVVEYMLNKSEALSTAKEV